MRNLTTLKPKSEVAHTELESGVAVLLDLETRKYYSLNETGSTIWQLVADGVSRDDIAARLVEKYSIDIPRAKNAVNSLLKSLSEAGLLIETS